jgi:hypothetical protein
MGFNWKLKALAALPFILIIISGVVASKIDVKYKMTQEEMEILGFQITDVKLPKGKEVTDRSLAIPTLIEKIMGEREAPHVKGEKKKEPVQLVVTMIIMSEKGSMAIVNNMVVKEGDSVSGQKILTIESNRILVEYTISPDPKSKSKTINKGTKWVNLS